MKPNPIEQTESRQTVLWRLAKREMRLILTTEVLRPGVMSEPSIPAALVVLEGVAVVGSGFHTLQRRLFLSLEAAVKWADDVKAGHVSAGWTDAEERELTPSGNENANG